MVHPGTRKHQEETREMKNKYCVKEEEIGDILST
jgi:hypothetical protein